jgi:acetyl-CoA decarbonylase/synthase complex subunit gamma
MRLVRIGPEGEAGVEIGQETAMFRHEEKFHRAATLAVKIPASLSDEEAAARLERVNGAVFTRVGEQIAVRLATVEIEEMDAERAQARVGQLMAASRVPFVLMGSDPQVMSAAVEPVAENRPLIYRATDQNADAFARIAADHNCPLAIAAENLEQLADMSKAAKDAGVEDVVLSFDLRQPARAIRQITTARRAALRRNFRPLGFPAMVDASMEDVHKETTVAATFLAKYAAIVIINGLDAAELLPLMTLVQNIYTDPQVPNTVEAKLYEVGDVAENSPVLFTTNFSLTYFCVEAEVERSKVPCYICVADTEGLGILNAYAGDKLSPEKVVKALAEQKVADKVQHRKLIIPGLIPSFRAEIEDTSEWKEVLIGPENASGIPAFLAQNWK